MFISMELENEAKASNLAEYCDTLKPTILVHSVCLHVNKTLPYLLSTYIQTGPPKTEGFVWAITRPLK